MLFDILFDQIYTLAQLLNLKEGKQMTWEQIAHSLYQILDDIDTADDMCKENTEAFRTLVMKLQAKKNQYMASFDGQTVQRVNEEDTPGNKENSGYSALFTHLAAGSKKITCPKCGESFFVSRSELPGDVECPECDEKFFVKGRTRPIKRRIQRTESIKEDMAQWAREELEQAGLFDKDSDYDGMIGQAVMNLIDEFSKQGHSGFSTRMVSTIFDRLLRSKPLSPLTSNPTEWMQVSEDMCGKGTVLHQSRRSPSCFSTDGGVTYYDLDEFSEEDRLEHDWVPTNPKRLHTSEPHKERAKR